MIHKIVERIKLLIHVKIKHKKPMDYYIDKWRKSGITIGDNCYFCCQLPVGRDSCLLSFGDNVLVSSGVLFLMHDAAPTTVSKGKGTDYLGKVTIGNSCFIGAHSIIMPGVSLADYTVVGAGSVVTHSTQEPGFIIAGNPAKVICTVEEYLRKNEKYTVNLDGMNLEDIRSFSKQNPDKLITRSCY